MKPIYLSAADRVQGAYARHAQGIQKAHCRGALGNQRCAEREACKKFNRFLEEPVHHAMTLPRIPGLPCRYFKPAE